MIWYTKSKSLRQLPNRLGVSTYAMDRVKCINRTRGSPRIIYDNFHNPIFLITTSSSSRVKFW